MTYGLSGIADSYYANMRHAIRKNKGMGNAAGNVGFLDAVSAKAADRTERANLKDMLKSKYPNSYYNVMDTAKIDDGAWERTDYPMDAFFKEPADESVLNWKPSGPQPDMQSAKARAIMGGTFGKIAVVVPPALEEKMKNDPRLAEQVMERVDSFIAKHYRVGETKTFRGATYTTLNQGFVITFDENGEIDHSCVTGESFSVSDSSFIEARKAREAKHAEYERLAEEAAMKRRQFAKLQYHKLCKHFL